MIYFIIAATLLVVLALAYSNSVLKKKKLNELRDSWTKLKKGLFEFGGISRYAAIGKGKDFHQLSSQLLDDIDVESLFKCIDQTTSRVGQQLLYRRLIHPSGNAENELQALIDLVSKNETLRPKIQQELLKLSHSDAYYVSSLFHDQLIERPKWLWLLKVDIAVVFAMLLLTIKFQVVALFLLIPFLVNMLLHYWNKNNTLTFIKSFPQLSVLMNVAGNISELDEKLHDKKINESVNQLKTIQMKAGLISFSDGGIQSELSQVGLYFYELLKAFFLIEVFSLFSAVKELESKRSFVETLFKYVGNIDVAISIVSLRSGKLKTCVPEFISEKRELVMKNVYHPLIKDCELNDLTISGKSILITGSNMSGKSTFLRTVAVNSILAQSIYTCFADEFKSPLLQQFSSIHIEDDLLSGKSYYMKEVETISLMVEEAATHHQKIFFLDEVFKGTNTVERVAAGKAVLSYLNQQNHFVIVATHDLELAKMLSTEFDLYHFTETIEDEQLHFDHKIKHGPLTSTNAIRILEIAEFPKEIILQARKISEAIRTRYS